MINLVIKKADHSQVAELIRLLSAQLQEHSLEVSSEQLRNAVMGVLECTEKGLLHVALNDGKPIGVSYLAFTWTIEHGGRAAWLEELYVEPEHRGKGIGENLLRETLAAARTAGCLAVDLEVDSDHRKVESLYQRNHFLRRDRSRWYRLL